MATLPPLPDGFTLDNANPPATSAPAQPQPAMPSNVPSLPPGFALDPHPAQSLPPSAAAQNPDVPEAMKPAANALQGLNNSVGAAIGLPNALASLGDYIGQKLGASPSPGFITRHTLSPEEINKGIAQYGGGVGDEMYFANDPAVQQSIGQPKPYYTPETFGGKVANHILAGAPLAAIGGGGVPALIGREFANATGTTAADTAHTLYPDSPGAAMIAGLFGGLGGSAIAGATQFAGRVAKDIGGKLIGTENAVNKAATDALVQGAQNPAPELLNRIDQNLPNWSFNDIPGITPNSVQPSPTLAAVTGDEGLRGLTYRDMTAADKRGNPVYRVNASNTNAAQREAIGNITPDVAPQVTANQAALANQVAALPMGVSAQDAGSTFRTGLQSVYDTRKAAQQAVGNNVYAPLETSTAQINLTPVMDYVRTQIASNPGDLGNAYARALQQFKTPSGNVLDTPAFSQGVLKSLGDLAQSYPVGSASNRAVIQVKDMLDNHVAQIEPGITQARQAYAQASRPLDIFDPTVEPGPIANAIQTTRFGGVYTTPNDSVVSQFLTSKAGPDAITKLTTVFPDVKTGTVALQDYIASQVRARAVNPDGSINPNALKTVLAPYGAVLQQPPFQALRRQFSDLGSAQQAVDQIGARQTLLDTFHNGLGLQARDANNVPMYSPRDFDKFVQANQGDLVSAYGQAGANRITQINRQLQAMAQTAQVKVPGTSGTAQSLNTGTDNVLGALWKQAGGEASGEVVGALMHGAGGALGLGAAGKLLGLASMGRITKFHDRMNETLTRALTDPAFAKNLLTNYNPRQVKPIGQKAMDYVKNQMGGIVAPQLTQ